MADKLAKLNNYISSKYNPNQIYNSTMRVQKRGTRGFEPVRFDKITERISHLCKGLNEIVDPTRVAHATIKNLFDGITTEELDKISAKIAESYKLIHPDYSKLAAKILISNLHKTTPRTFSQCMEIIGNTLDIKSERHYAFIAKNAAVLDNIIIDSNDYNFDYFGYKTLENAYLIKITEEVTGADGTSIYIDRDGNEVPSANVSYTPRGKPVLKSDRGVITSILRTKTIDRIVDRPQYVFMRVAIAIYMDYSEDLNVVLEYIKQCYKALSQMYFTHATPTLFNACSKMQQLNSCFGADTEVCTTAGVKKIQDVLVGDFVITHAGNVKRVEQTHVNLLGDRTLMDLKVQKTPHVKVTNDHRVWALKTRTDSPAWVRVDELTDRSYVGIPNPHDSQFDENPMIIDLAEFIGEELRSSYIYTITNDTISVKTQLTHIGVDTNGSTNHKDINRKWICDERFWKLIGIWLGDAHITNNDKKIPNAVGFTIGAVGNDDLIEFILLEGERIFGTAAAIIPVKNQNCIQIVFYSRTIAYVMEILFGSGFNKKHLWNKIFSLHRKYVYALLSGLITSNGCITREGNIMLEMANIPFVKSVYHLARNRGIDVSFNVRTHKFTPDTAQINFPYVKEILQNVNKTYTDERIAAIIAKREAPSKKNKNQTSAVIVDGKRFLRIESITPLEERPENVYTIGVADDHSYNVCGIEVINCFLLGTDDSIEGIMGNISNAAFISKWAGGIGIHMHNIRSRGTVIKGTNGKASGLVPQLKMYNETARTFDQGGKRLGAFAIYLEPWHGDILKFLEMKLNQGADTERARDLFYALWVNDLFVKRVEEDGDWSLFSENITPGLSDVYDGMEVCKHCGYCANSNFAKLVYTHTREEIIEALPKQSPDQASCTHEFESRDVFTSLYTMYEKEGFAVKVIKAREVMDAICEMQRESGTPYICFKDHVNRMSNQTNIGTIKSSNLCVTPDTYILTDKGQFKIIDVVGKRVNIWNGEGFSEVVPTKTGDKQKIITVNLSNGVSIECTEYHKYYIHRGNKITKIEAKDLLPGDKLIKYNLPTIYDGSEFKYAYTHGLFCADGAYENANLTEKPSDHPRIILYGEKQRLDRYLSKGLPSRVGNGETHVNLPLDIAPKFTVPVNARLGDKLAWFAGYCDGDGCVIREGANYSIQCGSINKGFLLQVRLMLQTMGVDSKITTIHHAKKQLLSTGNGSQRQMCYRLLITSCGIIRLQELGLDTNRLNIPYQIPQRNAEQFVTVISVEDDGKHSPTYCFTEQHRGMGMFNGVLTGNCAEIMEWSSDKSYACCTLASINLKKFLVESSTHGSTKYTINHEKLHEAARMIARNLDIIIDVNKYPVGACERNSKDYRPIGMGIQALADIFAIMRLPFTSDEAAKHDIEIAETIYHAALTESCERAKSHGAYVGFENSPAARGLLQFDLWERNQIRINSPLVGINPRSGRYDWDALKANIVKYGLRNSLHVAFMPTVSTSQIMGNNESFEPFSSNIYTKTTLAGKFTVTNNSMIHHLIELGIWNEDLKNKIVNNDGSLVGITEIPADVREIYKTVWEMPQRELMRRAALRSAFIDQSQSLNIHVRDNSNAVLRGVFMLGWKLGLKTGSYYIRSLPASRALKNNIAATKEAENREKNTPLASAPAPAVWKVLSPARREVEEDVPRVTPNDEPIDEGSCPIGCTSCSG